MLLNREDELPVGRPVIVLSAPENTDIFGAFELFELFEAFGSI
jgi:hypothetical protein